MNTVNSKLSSIGRNRVKLPRIGLGTGLHGEVSEKQSLETIEYALHSGVRFFDTAPLYGNGVSEERLGMALRGIPRDSYILNTKVGIKSGSVNGNVLYDFSTDGINSSIELSLSRLGVEYIDILHLHEPRGFARQVIVESLPVLLQLRRQGVIRAIGIGVNHWEISEPLLQYIDCILLAGRYTLLEQESLEFLESRYRAKMPVLGAGIFNSGILATGPIRFARYNYEVASPSVLEHVHELTRLCQFHGVELSHAAVQFVAAQPAIVSMIFGCCSRDELNQALTCLNDSSIPSAFWDDLRKHNLLNLQAPLPGCKG